MDHHKLFNKKSDLYAQVRPHYPQELYAFLVSLCDEQKSAWDAACGSGQAAIDLAKHFDEVQATDISEHQIANAIQNPGVSYSVQSAESTNFEKNHFDLVCVAQALHWFDYDLFFPQVKRVLKPSGIFAAWGYSWFSISNEIDKAIKENFLSIIEPYWAPQNSLLWNHYRDIPFPFEKVDAPQIEMKMDWDINQLFGYLQSWSAAKLCKEDGNNDFMMRAYEATKSAWGNASKKKRVKMDFTLLVGRNEV